MPISASQTNFEPCGKTTFGAKCNLICYCRNTEEPCGRHNGTCYSGCLMGWKGDQCHIKINANGPTTPQPQSNPNALLIGICASVVVAIIAVAGVSIYYIHRKYRQIPDHPAYAQSCHSNYSRRYDLNNRRKSVAIDEIALDVTPSPTPGSWASHLTLFGLNRAKRDKTHSMLTMGPSMTASTAHEFGLHTHSAHCTPGAKSGVSLGSVLTDSTMDDIEECTEGMPSPKAGKNNSMCYDRPRRSSMSAKTQQLIGDSASMKSNDYRSMASRMSDRSGEKQRKSMDFGQLGSPIVVIDKLREVETRHKHVGTTAST